MLTKNKNSFILYSSGLIVGLLLLNLIARDIYFTRSGKVSFFSSTPIEDIKADNNQATCVKYIFGHVKYIQICIASLCCVNNLSNLLTHMELEYHAYYEQRFFS